MRGARHQTARHCKHLLFAARQGSARPDACAPSDVETIDRLLPYFDPGSRRRVGIWNRSSDFLRTVKSEKIIRPSGTMTSPRSTRRLLIRRVMSSPAKSTLPFLAGNRTADTAQQRRFACSVASNQRRDFTFNNCAAKTMQGRNLTIGHVQLINFKQWLCHQLCPRYALTTASSVAIISGGPSAIVSPWCNTKMRGHIRIRAFITCSMTITVKLYFSLHASMIAMA